MIHQVKHELFQDHAQSARAHFAGHGFTRDGGQRSFIEAQLHALKLKHALVLLDDGVARAGEDFDQRGFVQVIENADDGQAADEFRDQAEADQVLGLGFLQQVRCHACWLQ